MLPPPPTGTVRLQTVLPGAVALEKMLQIRGAQSEYDRLIVDRSTLQNLADETQGKLVPPEEIPTLDDLLPKTPEITILSGPPKPLWDRVWVVWAFVVALSLEWLLRKFRKLS
jgi:hypothetical protein